MKKSILTSLSFSLSLFLFSQPAFIKDSLDKYVEREMKRWNVPGAAVVIVKDGKVVVMKGYGVRETGKSDKVDENTLFQIASNSKAFTGTSIALLDHQKRLSLDDKVVKWIKDFKMYDELATREATVRDMLCHRIGFQTFQSDFLNWNCNVPRRDLVLNMKNVKPVYGFRARYGYCNVGFVAAGEVMLAATDTTWDDFLKYHFFQPLKMGRTSTTYKAITTDNNACKPYTLMDDRLVALPYANIDNLGPAASINSCVKDLANWLMMWLDSGRFEGKRVFPYEVLRKTTASQMLVQDMAASSGATFQTYGLGWFMLDYHGKKLVRHDGGADGFVTTTCFVPQLNLGVAVLTNTDANSFYSALRAQVLDAYMQIPYVNRSLLSYKTASANNKAEWDEIKKMRETAARKPAAAAKPEAYAGTYRNEVYGKIEVKNTNGELTVLFAHHPFLTGKLEALGENDFLCTYNVATYGIKKINFTLKDDKVRTMVVRVNDFVDMMEYEFIKE